MLLPKPPKKKGRHRQTIECDISPKVKAKVWERDGQCCIICGSPQAMPNAHYISRAHAGLGIEQNIVTLCQQCHHDFDNGDMREVYGAIIKGYLMGNYPDWDEAELYYRKGM